MSDWLATAPSPFIRGVDPTPRGWKLHCIDTRDDEPLAQLRGKRAVCGLLPAHGWCMDFFIEDKCARCTKALARITRPPAPQPDTHPRQEQAQSTGGDDGR